MHRMFIPTDVPYSREKKLGQGKVEDIRGVWRRTGGVACKGAPAPAWVRFSSGRTQRETVAGETHRWMERNFRKV